MDNTFPEIKKMLAFGCMRLPMLDGEVDIEQFKQMVDLYIERGFNYFDTAHGYIDGKSEKALKVALTSRHNRDEYLLVDKLSDSYFNSEEEIRPFFESQLEILGVDYLDFYLMHAQGAHNYPKYQKFHAYETAMELKKEGKIRHVGLSFHDKPEVLDQILTDHPDVEFVQIQFNYVDYEDASVQSKDVYEVCRKHGKPVLIMEPVKGGKLVDLPEEAQKIFDELGGGSNASYAIRFAASFEGVAAVLSGMSSLDQMKDNLSYMEDFKPLTDKEMSAVVRVSGIYNGLNTIKCTSCRYCVEQNHCPMDILIPDLFSCTNKKRIFQDWNQGMYYRKSLTVNGHGKASDCIKCGMCESVCPQHLPIRNLLEEVAAEFEK